MWPINEKIKIMKTKIVVLLLGIFYLLLPVQSQVTIGSISQPREGSLLELKETDNTDDNSMKGFSLPRVRLNSPNSLTVDDDSKGGEYKGLTVQNTNTSGGLVEGVYCWDGKMWELVVAVDGQGTDGQLLTSKGAGNAPSWRGRAEMYIPVVALVADRTGANNTFPAKTVTNITYDVKYANNFSYSNAVFTPHRSGYYQISVYNKLDISMPNINKTDNKGTAITKVSLKESTNSYKDILSFSAYYPLATNHVNHPLSGLIYLTAGENYVIRTTYEKRFQVIGGRITLAYLGD